ncbi:MAG: crosslink repair DNA glycosylase YcaQ family protein, partial [Acidimicrobiia bacterium]
LIDYYWIRAAEGRPAISALLADGSLVEVEVEGWPNPAYLYAEARIPRATNARALINPFDPLVWNRERIERLHDFYYRVEIYVPEPKRIHGYYVFPFLLDDDFVARIDLKADRKAGMLRVLGAFVEDGVEPIRVARELAVELGEMARWLGLREIVVSPKGDLAPQLRKAV